MTTPATVICSCAGFPSSARRDSRTATRTRGLGSAKAGGPGTRASATTGIRAKTTPKQAGPTATAALYSLDITLCHKIITSRTFLPRGTEIPAIWHSRMRRMRHQRRSGRMDGRPMSTCATSVSTCATSAPACVPRTTAGTPWNARRRVAGSAASRRSPYCTSRKNGVMRIPDRQPEHGAASPRVGAVLERELARCKNLRAGQARAIRRTR